MDYAFVDFRITEEEKFNLERLGCNVVLCPPCNLLYDAICGHPDILIHFLSKNHILIHRDMDENFITLLQNLNFKVDLTKNNLASNYPKDIILNAINLKNYFIHNIKATDSKLLEYVSDKVLIHVNQGYTKCSTAIISPNALITNDTSIYKALEETNIDVLLLPPGDIELPGLDYGFIGGTCGLLRNSVVFFGTLEKYTYKEKVLDFLRKYSITPIYLSDTPLIDRGSIFFIEL